MSMTPGCKEVNDAIRDCTLQWIAKDPDNSSARFANTINGMMFALIDVVDAFGVVMRCDDSDAEELHSIAVRGCEGIQDELAEFAGRQAYGSSDDAG